MAKPRRTDQKADHRGMFAHHHDNAPPPFNPLFDPLAKGRYAKVTASMEADNFYARHTREECKAEWGRRYDKLAADDQQARSKAC